MAQFLHIAAATIAKGFRAAYGDGTNLTTYTFSACDFGAPDTSREVFVVIGWSQGANRTLTSVTIGGVAATLGSQANQSTQAGVRVAFAAVPSGTTGDVVCTFSGGVVSCAIAVYRVTDRPIAGATETDFASQGQSLGTSAAIAGVDVATGGFTLSALAPLASTSGGSPSGLSIALDGSVAAGNLIYFASNSIQASAGSATVTWTWASTTSAIAAAWSFS